MTPLQVVRVLAYLPWPNYEKVERDARDEVHARYLALKAEGRAFQEAAETARVEWLEAWFEARLADDRVYRDRFMWRYDKCNACNQPQEADGSHRCEEGSVPPCGRCWTESGFAVASCAKPRGHDGHHADAAGLSRWVDA